VESAVFHDIEAGYEFGVGLSLRAAITNVTDEDPPFVGTNRTPTPTQPHTRCWGAPTSSSCAMHFGSSRGGCRHEARLRLEPREFRLSRLPEYLRRRAQQPQHSIGFELRLIVLGSSIPSRNLGLTLGQPSCTAGRLSARSPHRRNASAQLAKAENPISDERGDGHEHQIPQRINTGRGDANSWNIHGMGGAAR
jgi:hypothetical protein